MNKLINYLIFVFIFIILIIGIMAHAEEDFAQAEELIKQKISCSSLNDEQLELIGDYYMEQMHPGELHEIMDERMGGEGSESLRQTHIAIARAFYCGERGYMSANMMNIMMGRNSFGMMGYAQNYQNSYGISGANTLNLIILILIIIIIVLLIVLLIKKIFQSNKNKRRSR